MRTTHTVATLIVTKATYDEIAAKLRATTIYDHVFMQDGTMDMTGIGLKAEPAPPAKPIDPEMVPASDMSSVDIRAQLTALEARWDEMMKPDPDDEGHGGSPGEWLWERMGELAEELRRRGHHVPARGGG